MRFIGKLPLKLQDHRGKEYTIKLPIQSGGKAGKGYNKTSTIQVMYEYFLVKQIRYTVADHNSKMEALKKAISYAIGEKKASLYFSDTDFQNS